MSQFALNWSQIDPAQHFLATGAKLLVSPSREFNARACLDAWPDILESGLDPLSYYILRGFGQERKVYAESENPPAPGLLEGRARKEPVLARGRVAIYAASARGGRIADSVVMAVEELREFADAIIFAANHPLPPSELLKIRHLLFAWTCGDHDRSYHESYVAALRMAARTTVLNNARELAFLNDLIFAPLESFDNVRTECAAQDKAEADVLYATWPGFSSETLPPPFCLVRGKENMHAPADLFIERIFGKPMNCRGAAMEEFGVYENARDGRPFFLPNPSAAGNFLTTNVASMDDMPAFFSFAEAFKKIMAIMESSARGFYNVARAECGPFLNAGPRFSLIMPVYENVQAVVETTKSFLRQDRSDAELIIIDDASGPEMEAEINYRFGGELESRRISYIKNQTHIGETGSRKEGVKVARYEWSLHISPFMKLPPNFLPVLAILVAANPDEKIFHIDVRSSLMDEQQRNSGSGLMTFAGMMHETRIMDVLYVADDDPGWLGDRKLAEELLDGGMPYHPALPVFRPSAQEVFINPELKTRPRWLDKNLEDVTAVTIIPCREHGEFLEEAIDSALMQRGAFRHQIILADDLSEDNSPEICAAWAARYPDTIRSLSSGKRLGVYPNIRRAIEQADGDVICLLSGDDYWTDENKIESQLEFLASQVDCRMCFSSCIALDQYFMEAREVGLYRELPQKFGIDELARHLHYVPVFSGMMCDAATLLALPTFSGQILFSEYLVAAWFTNFGQIGFIPSVQLVYRERRDSIWHSMNKEEQFVAGARLRILARRLVKGNARQPLDQAINWFEKQAATLQNERGCRNPVI